MKLSFFIVMLTVLFLGSCGTVKTSRETVRTVKDSTYTEVTYRKKDTTIFIPGDTLQVKVPITEITKEPIKKSNGRNTVIIRREGNDLDIDCINEDLQHRLDLLETIIKENSTKYITEHTKEIVPEPYTPWPTKALAWFGGIALAFGLFMGARKLKFI